MYQTEQENNLEGAHIVFACDEGLTLTGPEDRICQENGQWTGEGDNDCIGKTSGSIKTFPCSILP